MGDRYAYPVPFRLPWIRFCRDAWGPALGNTVPWRAIPPLALELRWCRYASTVFPKSPFITCRAQTPRICLSNRVAQEGGPGRTGAENWPCADRCLCPDHNPALLTVPALNHPDTVRCLFPVRILRKLQSIADSPGRRYHWSHFLYLGPRRINARPAAARCAG
jgi:hypothetical protein